MTSSSVKAPCGPELQIASIHLCFISASPVHSLFTTGFIASKPCTGKQMAFCWQTCHVKLNVPAEVQELKRSVGTEKQCQGCNKSTFTSNRLQIAFLSFYCAKTPKFVSPTICRHPAAKTRYGSDWCSDLCHGEWKPWHSRAE